MLGEFTRQDEADRGLDFPGGDGRLLVVSREAGGFGGDLFEDVVDERVHDGHRLGGDTGVRVDLLEHLVDVDLVGFRLGLAATLLGARRLLLSRLLTGHCYVSSLTSCQIVTTRSVQPPHFNDFR